jgi:pimeloyl-ACP methyl ester carboxylesterase
VTGDVCWLLLHGTPLTPVIWDQVAAQLRPRAPTHIPTVIPAGEVADVQRALAQQVLGELDERLQDIHVVGHSFGGQVALDIALVAPERVRSLTMICSRDTPYPPFGAAAAAPRRGDAVDINGAMSRWFRPEELHAEGSVVRYARHCLRHADRSSWADALDGIANYDRSLLVSRLDLPVTLIAAEFDQVSKPADMAELGDRVAGSQLQVLRGAAHMTPFTDPTSLAELILGASRR